MLADDTAFPCSACAVAVRVTLGVVDHSRKFSRLLETSNSDMLEQVW